MDHKITVITASVGHKYLGRCIKSVQEQTHPNVEHYIVVDGPEHKERVKQILEEVTHSLGGQLKRPIHTLTLPYNIGANGWNGHRVYGSVPYLCNTTHVAFLDEDNWYNRQHLESLFQKIKRENTRWGFSLRNIYTEEGDFVCQDKCESLGSLSHTVIGKVDYLVDTSCYLLERELAIESAKCWNYQALNAGYQGKENRSHGRDYLR